jgi:thiamine biosynthesis lipoprotein
VLWLAPAPAAARGASGSPAPSGPAVIERTRVVMGTLLRARVEAASESSGAAALADAFDEVARLERVMSSWRDDSEVARLNAAGTAPFALSPDLAAVLDSSLALASLTAGAFDPTVEPLSGAWDLRGAGRLPGAAEIEDARARTGWAALSLDPVARRARFGRDRMGVDLGGIGKGYALDRMAATLAARGVTRGWLDFGGQLRAVGAPGADAAEAASGSFRFAVAHPLVRERGCVTLPLGGGSAATSAQSERSFARGRRRFGHVLDPRNGRPVPGRASVTVVASSGTRADALSTALLVMGREAAAGLAASHPDVGVLWLEPAGRAVRAWCWNLSDVAGAPGAPVRWMNPEPAPGLTSRTKGRR